MNSSPKTDAAPGRGLIRLLEHPQLPRLLALGAMFLCLPSLWLGFHLDDHIHRLLLGNYPSSASLLQAYESPFGIANGEPAINRWQVDHGYAPWWIDPELLVSLWRPVSEATHRLDAALWPDAALPMHLHSLLWLGALVLAATRLYRLVLGTTAAAGLAAAMYAFDHAHGFAVGWIANRNAVVAACFGVLCLAAHVRWRRDASTPQALLALAAFAAALLSGEASVAVLGYVGAHALCMERGPLGRRALSLVPYLLVVVAWRALYSGLGHGAHGSGLYVDPVREPLAFAMAALERAPLLALGQLALPPAELALFAPAPVPLLMWLGGLLLLLALALASRPLWRDDGELGFFGLGMLASLLAACSTHPNNRLLFFAGIGAMGLLAVLWRRVVRGEQEPQLQLPAASRWLIALLVGFHLVLSPLLLPLTTCSILITSPVHEAVASPALQAQDGSQDVVIVNSPDYFYTKLIGVSRELQGKPTSRTLHTLAYGPVELQLTVLDAARMEVRYGPAVPEPGLMELYRRSDHAFAVGDRVVLQGLEVRIEEVTEAGRVRRAHFHFEAGLAAAQRRWLRWDGNRYVPFQLPATGTPVTLEPARVPVLGGS